jgi:hypothetical protein
VLPVMTVARAFYRPQLAQNDRKVQNPLRIKELGGAVTTDVNRCEITNQYRTHKHRHPLTFRNTGLLLLSLLP